MNDYGANNLRIAIARQAADDLRKEYNKSEQLGCKTANAEALERWFVSQWAQILIGEGGQYIVDKIKKEPIKKKIISGIQPVRCIENGIVYASALEAAQALNLSYTAVRMCAAGKQNKAGGFHFERVKVNK